ncbi:glycosyltransferase family 2 protein, partial [Peribacillus sp. NPDC060253]
MTVKVLISTMNESEPRNLLKKMNISSDAVIINQCGYKKADKFRFHNNKITYICNDETGLSRSRNKAILNTNKDDNICLLADDDLIYVANYCEVVKIAFDENPDYDIITFQVEGKNKFFKSYRKISKRLGYFSSLKVSSVEIAFN